MTRKEATNRHEYGELLWLTRYHRQRAINEKDERASEYHAGQLHGLERALLVIPRPPKEPLPEAEEGDDIKLGGHCPDCNRRKCECPLPEDPPLAEAPKEPRPENMETKECGCKGKEYCVYHRLPKFWPPTTGEGEKE